MKANHSPFHTANQALRQLLHYFRYDLQMPTETIRQMVAGILTSFEVAEIYERENAILKGPERDEGK
jgi:hypothetical protein